MTKLLHRLKRIFGIEEFEFDEPEDEKTQFYRIKNEAEAGKKDALYRMSKYYFEGTVVGQDYVKGHAFLKEAAAHGHLTAAGEAMQNTRFGLGVMAALAIRERHYCSCCGRFYDVQRWMQFESDKYLCEACQKRLVNDSQIQDIEQNVRNFYVKEGLGKIGEVTLKTVSLSELKRMRQLPFVPWGLTYASSHRIFAFRYLTPELFSYVFAHELLHVWQFEHGMTLPQIELEGLCELGASLYLLTLKSEDAQHYVNRKMTNTDSIYGEGLRNMYKLYEQGGWTNVLSHLTVKDETE